MRCLAARLSLAPHAPRRAARASACIHDEQHAEWPARFVSHLHKHTLITVLSVRSTNANAVFAPAAMQIILLFI